jgi:excisionase family DNA binding protein
MTDRLLVSPREAANLLGIGRSTIYLLLRSGDLQSIHIGACRRIPLDSVNSLVQRLREAEQGVSTL